MQLGKALRELRKEKGWSQIQLAERLGKKGCEITQKAVSKWERGDTMPNAEQFLILCDLYQVRDVLAAFCDAPGELASLNQEGRKRVQEYIRLLQWDSEFSLAPRKPATRLMRSIPLYDLPASAGTGQFLDSNDYELIEVDETVPLSATFAVRISGDSMTPRYVDKQIVYVKQQHDLERGEIGIFVLNGNAYCKMLSGNAETELVSLNGKYAPIKVREYDELWVLGKVVS